MVIGWAVVVIVALGEEAEVGRMGAMRAVEVWVVGEGVDDGVDEGVEVEEGVEARAGVPLVTVTV